MMEEVKQKRQREALRLITICNFCVYCVMQLVSELQVRAGGAQELVHGKVGRVFFQ